MVVVKAIKNRVAPGESRELLCFYDVPIPLSLRYIGTSCTDSVVLRLCGTPVYFFYRGGTRCTD